MEITQTEPQMITTPIPNDGEIMQGGLPPMEMPTAPVDTTQAVETTQQPEVKKYFVGNKSFATAEEALAYANGMEEMQARASASLSKPTDPVEVQAKPRLGQLLFENPDEALEQVKQQAKSEIREEQRAIAERTEFWHNFYSEHTDLKGMDTLVDAVLEREKARGGLAQLTWNQAAPILAAKARAELLKIRNVPSGGQALSSRPAMVASSNGASTPMTPAPKAQPTTFVQELMGRRIRKG